MTATKPTLNNDNRELAEEHEYEILMRQMTRMMMKVKASKNKEIIDRYMQQVAAIINYKVENGKISEAEGVGFLKEFIRKWNEL